MIKAINKEGRIAYFTERVWDMMQKPNRNGWVVWSEHDEANIPLQVIEFKAKKKMEKDAVSVAKEDTKTTKKKPNVSKK